MPTGAGTHHSGTHGWLRLAVAVALVLVLLLTLEASSAAEASSMACQVRNAKTGQTYTRLQKAVDAAKPGAHLIVTGTCHGKTVILKDLTISGKRTGRAERPTIEGWTDWGYLLRVKCGVTVTLRSLTIRSGGRPRWGGGIHNCGTLTLRDVTVRDYDAPNWGGGVLNKGTLRLVGHTLITRNNAGKGGGGGGVYNAKRATLWLGDSSRIEGNRAWSGGGVENWGQVILNDTSRINGNVAGGPNGSGGGVTNYRLLILNDTSRISGNRAVSTTDVASQGGGVSSIGDVILNGASSITGNTAGEGGGLRNLQRVTLNDASSITGNTAGEGGGVFNSVEGMLTMTGSSSVSGNTAGTHGGGLYNATYNALSGTLIGVGCAPQTLANVYGNTPDDCYFE